MLVRQCTSGQPSCDAGTRPAGAAPSYAAAAGTRRLQGLRAPYAPGSGLPQAADGLCARELPRSDRTHITPAPVTQGLPVLLADARPGTAIRPILSRAAGRPDEPLRPGEPQRSRLHSVTSSALI